MTVIPRRYDESVPGLVLDLFAGPGGWDVGAAWAGLPDPLGIEVDEHACMTRVAAGLPTIRADVTALPLEPFARRGVEGLIASPPCTAFSQAGKQLGVGDLPAIHRRLERFAAGVTWCDETFADPTSVLICEPLRWALTLRPRWVACEQVPPALAVWRHTARLLEDAGYSTWTGVLNAADYGVPQTRRRGVLLARLDGPALPPAATHDRAPEPGLFGAELRPWISMALALGWTGRAGFPRRDDQGDSEDGYRERDWREADEPAFNVTEKARSWVRDSYGEPTRDGEPAPRDKPADDVAPTVDTKSRSWRRIDRPAPVVTGGGGMGTPEPFRDPDVRDEIADDLAELTVANGMNTMKHSRDVDDMIPYERPVTEPAPTVDPKAGGAWSVGEPGHRQPPESWKRRKLVERQAHGAERDEDEPAMTITSSADNGNFLIEEHDVPRGVHRPTTGMPSGRLERDGDRPGPSVSTDAHTWRLTQEGDPSPEAGKLPTYRPPEDDADRLFDVGPAEVGSGREHSTRYHDSAHDHLEGTVSLQRRSAGAPPVDTEREPSPGIAGAAMAKGVWQVEDRRDLTPEQESLASEPAPTIVGGRRSADGAVVGRQLPPGQDESVGGWSDRRDGLAGTRVESDQADRKDWADDRPATTVAARELVADPGHNANRDGGTKSRNDGIRVELEDVLVLQSFPEDYPVQGSRTERFRQAGNAVPPRLAAHVLASVAGLDPPEFGDPWPRRGSTGGS